MKRLLYSIAVVLLTYALIRSINNPVGQEGYDPDNNLWWLGDFLHSWGFYIGDTIRVILKWLFTGWW